MTALYAGAAETIITPPGRTPLLGAIQRSEGVHDDLYARTVVLNDGRARVAVVCLDLIGMDLMLADDIRRAIRDRSGITTTLLNCSHTHSAPFTIPWSVLGWRWMSGPGHDWRINLSPKIAELVVQADKAAEPVVLRAGRAPVQIGFNRRLPTDNGVVMKPNATGVVVPWVDVLRIDRTDGTPLAVLFSHAAHPVIVHGASRQISADFPGSAVRQLKSRFGGNVVAMFAQACGANINANPLRGGFPAADRAGTALANAAFDASSKSDVVSAKEFRITSTSVNIPLQPLPRNDECSDALKAAEERFAQCCGESTMDDERLWEMQDELEGAESQNKSRRADDVQPMEGRPWWLMDTILCLRDLMRKIESGDDHQLRFEAHLLRVGDHWSLLAATHELFAEFQLWFDGHAPTERKMMLAYTNGCESYIPTDRDLALGGYEAASFPLLDGAALRYPYRRAIRTGSEQQVIESLASLFS